MALSSEGVMTMAKRKNAPISITTKRSDADVLRLRLESGYERIELARQSGVDTRTWEEFWVNLLHEYEMVCDGLDQAA
jgi:transposase